MLEAMLESKARDCDEKGELRKRAPRSFTTPVMRSAHSTKTCSELCRGDEASRFRYRYWTCARKSFLRGLPGVKPEAQGAKALKERLRWTAEAAQIGQEQGWSAGIPSPTGGRISLAGVYIV